MTIKSNRQVLHEQIAQGKIKQFDIQDYTATKMKRLSEKTIKDIHNYLRKRTLERLKGLYKAGFITKEDVENYRMEPTWSQFEIIDKAIMSIGKYARFLSDIRKSTVTGRRAHLEATIEGLQESGWDFINEENIDDFIEFQTTATELERTKWYEILDRPDHGSQTRPFALERYFREYQLNKGTISFEQLPEHFKEDFKKVNGVYTLRRLKR